MALRTILFDLGNVLLKFSHERMIRQIGRACGRDETWARSWLIDAGRQWKYERGEMSEIEFASELSRDARGDVAPLTFRQALGDIFQPNSPMDDYVGQLKQHGLRLVLLSNTCFSHVEWIRAAYSVLAPFDHLVLSHEVGSMKPDSAIFQEALRHIHCEPGECYYTDDIPAYVAAGRHHGFDAELFTTPGDFVRLMARRGIDLVEPQAID